MYLFSRLAVQNCSKSLQSVDETKPSMQSLKVSATAVLATLPAGQAKVDIHRIMLETQDMYEE